MDAPRCFCLQQYMPRYGGVRFVTVWKQSTSEVDSGNSPRRHRRGFVCDVFLQRRHGQVHDAGDTHTTTPASTVDTSANDDDERVDDFEDGDDRSLCAPAVLMNDELIALSLDTISNGTADDSEDELKSVNQVLLQFDLDPEIVGPLLYYMRRATSDLLARVNDDVLAARRAVGTFS